MVPWQRVMLGVHLDFGTMLLTERYVDMNQVGLFGYFRGSASLSVTPVMSLTRVHLKLSSLFPSRFAIT